MKPANQVRKDILDAISDLTQRYEDKSDLIQAEETHGEVLDEEFIGNQIVALSAMYEQLENILADLSYIE